MNETNSNWRERAFRYAPLFLWIGVIFFLSSTQGAMSNTSRIIRPLLEWLFPSASVEIITGYHAFIRKCAHFTEYAVLAFWSWRAFRGGNPRAGKGAQDGRTGERKPGFEEFARRNWFFVSFLLVALIASIDEFNQSFNTLRTGSPHDVLLDVSGGTAVILFLWFFTRKRPTPADVF
jgi:VanZ family protein